MVIVLVCFLFMGKLMMSSNIDWSILNFKQMRLMIFLSFLGAGSIYLVAYAWSLILKFIEYKPVQNRKLAYIYVRANVAKYLPGNVMNLVGRNVLAGQLGFKQRNIAVSTLIEMILFVVTTIGLSVLFLINSIGKLYDVIKVYGNLKLIMCISTIIILIIIIVSYLVIKNNKYLPTINKYLSTNFLIIGFKSIGLYSIYFIFSGIVLSLILSKILGVNFDFNILGQSIGFYVLSYFIGYITPGAPGGMGVRETILILLLTGLVGVDVATFASIFHRVFTIFSDIFIYAGIYILSLKEKRYNHT